MTLETFREEGNLPDENERLTSLAIGMEISADISFKILVGILLGPELFESGIVPINLETSRDVTGDRNIDFRFGCFKNAEKCFSLTGILDLIVSATLEKKELKWLATRRGSEVTVPSISREIGFAVDEVLRDMISLTPCQILRILLEF